MGEEKAVVLGKTAVLGEGEDWGIVPTGNAPVDGNGKALLFVML